MLLMVSHQKKSPCSGPLPHRECLFRRSIRAIQVHDGGTSSAWRYDEHFFFNKVATFLYFLDEGEPAIKQIEERLIENGGASFSERYLESGSEEHPNENSR